MRGGMTVVSTAANARLADILRSALDETLTERVNAARLARADLTARRVLFAVSVDAYGLSEDWLSCLRYLRQNPDALEGSAGAMLIDGETALDTKSIARELAFAASMAGCRFPGKPLVEATGALANFDVLAGVRGVDRMTAYRDAAAALVGRLNIDAVLPVQAPRVLMLHASDKARSNTLSIGLEIEKRLLAEGCAVETLSMQEGPLYECYGCSYTACAHFATQSSCYYGGVLPEKVFPALGDCDALLMLCPNYNDAPGAHFLALNNRINALLLRGAPLNKPLYAVVVSGYSGGDIVARQLLGGFCLNKGFSLPPRFCLLETANDPGSALRLPGIADRIDAFARGMLGFLRGA